MSILEIKNLNFTYKQGHSGTKLLKDLNFTVNQGDFIAIQGSSGSGKSTLFYLLGCMLKPDSGELLFEGKDLSKFSDEQAALFRNQKIGFVFQQFFLLPRATVLENILLPASYTQLSASEREVLKKRAIELAKKVGLEDQMHKHPSGLSGGQQQRVAIARALLNDPPFILADEPTGNLDSKNVEGVLNIFRELNEEGKTIIVITHDDEVARFCKKIVLLKDGVIIGIKSREEELTKAQAHRLIPPKIVHSGQTPWNEILQSVPNSLDNLWRNKVKSFLTMLGIIIGIASVLSMLTLGQFSKAKIMESFEALGVNKLVLRGYQNWNLKATDNTSGISFSAFEWEKDLLPIKRIFPEIGMLSPVLNGWNIRANYGGKELSGKEASLLGVNNEYLSITNSHLESGRNFSPFHVDNRSRVCIIGSGIVKELFLEEDDPLGKIMMVVVNEHERFPCQIIGVLTSQKSNKEHFQPDLQILIPFTSFPNYGHGWMARIHQVSFQIKSHQDVEVVAKKMKNYFTSKYGVSGFFSVDMEGTLVAQTKRFLNIFAVLLTVIAFLALLVGGIGIHNMMLVSVVERIKEIGLRKALGATNFAMKSQVLAESMLLCLIAGILGITFGLGVTEAIIFGASKFIPNFEFSWVVDPYALIISTGSILLVGFLSGMSPSYKAEKLEVIEALRAE